ncbi:PhaM family polyhydroxyalkanoate granule multifunctional regulatory protein [Piscinibacter sakaiensis]|uniref:PhaM family polyhydroxyalkanoate granule multifunctional regulatory protein n=1 Tax=Piscinibacter sakaiensis TaxID=1547922 RepID=UPI003AACE304
MNTSSDFGKMMPGFDFLQGLVKNAGAALPGVGQWVAPTLDPAELEKRIDELRTVQFWLEQNARMLATTIQALEVQRMTLSTLQTMNVQMNDLQESLKIKPKEAAEPKAAAAPPAEKPAQAAKQATPAEGNDQTSGEPPKAAPAVDPMLWWSALTKQFGEIAANAVQQGAGKGLAASMGRQSVDGVADDKPARKTSATAKKPARKSAASKADNKSAADKAGNK